MSFICIFMHPMWEQYCRAYQIVPESVLSSPLPRGSKTCSGRSKVEKSEMQNRLMQIDRASKNNARLPLWPLPANAPEARYEASKLTKIFWAPTLGPREVALLCELSGEKGLSRRVFTSSIRISQNNCQYLKGSGGSGRKTSKNADLVHFAMPDGYRNPGFQLWSQRES